MAAVETVRAIPWWKEPTKDQWYAYVAAWLGWTLDAFDFTVFLLIMVPIAKEFNVPLTRCRDRLHPDLVDAAGRRDGGGLDGRPDGPQDAADDLDRLVLGLQLHRRVLADLLVPSACSAPCSASVWAPNGRAARRWRWRNGRSARAA